MGVLGKICTLWAVALSVTEGLAQFVPSQANVTGYNIDLRFLTPVSEIVEGVFLNARERWESVITTDYETKIQVNAGQQICGMTVADTDVIEDLLIYVLVQGIDGEGKILAQAGPCGTDSQGRIRVGIMQFDEADLQRLLDAGTANATVMHEMGHVLGFGTLWSSMGLVGEPDDDDHEIEGYDLRFLGEEATIGNEEVGLQYEAVVEDSGGPGTAGSHWEEDIYRTELMTGYVAESGPNPMSILTILSLADIGYTVDTTKADNYTVDKDVIDELEYDDLKANLRGTMVGKMSLRQKLGDKSEKAGKESYGNDVLNHEMVLLEEQPKVRESME